VAVSCDAIQVYAGLEILSGAASVAEQERLEHRLLGMVALDGEFSAGQFAQLAHDEIDALLADGRRPILVGGTGLYMRAALAELDMRPPVSPELRATVTREIDERGSQALHAELDPELAAGVHPNDAKRVGRLTELVRAGIEPPKSGDGLWTSALRRPTTLVGLVAERDELRARIDGRVDEMLRLGVEEEVRGAEAAGASRTARYAIGFDALLRGDVEAMRTAQWQFARRQLTWLRKMSDVTVIDRTGRDDDAVAEEIVRLLG
jgi:tRNA dimethylallyltransferase